MIPGRLVIVKNQHHSNSLAMILQVGSLSYSNKFTTQSDNPLEKIYVALILCDKSYEKQSLLDTFKQDDRNTHELANDKDIEHVYNTFLLKDIFKPNGQSGQVVEEVFAADISEILNKMLKLEYDKIIDNHKKRLIPRFR